VVLLLLLLLLLLCVCVCVWVGGWGGSITKHEHTDGVVIDRKPSERFNRWERTTKPCSGPYDMGAFNTISNGPQAAHLEAIPRAHRRIQHRLVPLREHTYATQVATHQKQPYTHVRDDQPGAVYGMRRYSDMRHHMIRFDAGEALRSTFISNEYADRC
jgi:hypothetical protein